MERMDEKITGESVLSSRPKSAEQEAYLRKLRALLKDDSLSEEQKLKEMERPMWELIRMLQGKRFTTAKLSLKSLIAFRQQGRDVEGPKMPGTFGASCLYPVFDYMGLLRG